MQSQKRLCARLDSSMNSSGSTLQNRARGSESSNKARYEVGAESPKETDTEYVRGPSVCRSILWRTTFISSEPDNGNVHRAAAKIIVSKSRAARGSVCNVLLCRRVFGLVECNVVGQFGKFQVAVCLWIIRQIAHSNMLNVRRS